MTVTPEIFIVLKSSMNSFENFSVQKLIRIFMTFKLKIFFQLSSSVSGDWPLLYREFFKRQVNFLGWLEKKKIECRAKIYVS